MPLNITQRAFKCHLCGWELLSKQMLAYQVLNVLALCRQPDIRVSSLILLTSDICQWNTTSAFSHGSPPLTPFYWLPYQSAILPSHPQMDVTLRVCLSPEQSSWRKRWGCPKNCERKKKKKKKTDQVRTSFWPGWSLTIQCQTDKDQRQDGEYLSVCHPPSVSICSPFQTEGSDRSRGSCLRLRPWRIWFS